MFKQDFMKNLLCFFLLFFICLCKSQSPSEIIGKPIQIGNLEIAQYDFPNKMNWYDAKEVCSKLGEGWRLPTKEELDFLFENKEKIGGFSKKHYWSSSENFGEFAWKQRFKNGNQHFFYEQFKCIVRAVRFYNN